MSKISPAPNNNHPEKGLQRADTLAAHNVRSLKEDELGVDDSIIDLNFEKNLTKIDYDKMKQTLKEKHARKLNGEPYNCSDVCCNFESGSHYCLESSEKSDLTKFGVGIMLYFKFIKHLIFFFFLCILLSVPALVLYSASFSTYNKKSRLDYLDLLTATTLGSLGIGSSSCGIGKYPDYASSAAEMEINFDCPASVISDVSSISFGFVETGSLCAFFDDSDLVTRCNVFDETTLQSAFSGCTGQESCTFTIPTNIFTSKVSSPQCDEVYKTHNVYIRMPCATKTLVLFNGFEIEKTTVALTVAVLDVVIILIFLLMIYSLKYAQNSATKNVLKKAYSASAYTVMIKNLPQQWSGEELAARLWKFLDYKLGNKETYGNHRVVDVQIVLPNRLIGLNQKIGEVIKEKNTLIREFMQLYVPHYQGYEIDLKEVYNQLLILREQRYPKLHEAAKMYKKIKDLSVKKKKLLLEVKRLKNNREVKIICAFVTFSSIPARNKVLDVFSSSPLDRFTRIFCNCCYDKDISFHGHILQAMSADDPGSILWENIGEPGFSIFLRRAFSAFLTVVMWGISGAILLISTYYKNYFKELYPSIDCSDKDPTVLEAADDYLLGDYQVGLLNCYCSADIIGRINTIFTTVDNKKLCHEWLANKAIESSVTFGIVFAVLLINFGMQFIFQGLSMFEKHSTLNKQIAQRVIKTFVAQFLNTGILILLINAKLESISFWQGKFKDLTPLWYENVGSTLLSTMVINIFTVPILKMIYVLYQKIRRWCDRGCTSDLRKTSRKTQPEYENLYMGPEFILDFRYSQILTLTFVCFLYSGSMPFLYITSFAQLVLTYYFDKLLLLRVCVLPKNYDEKLEQVVRVTLYGIIVLHLFFTIFAYGSPLIFEKTTSPINIFNTYVDNISGEISQSSDNVIIKFFRRTQLQHNLPLAIVLIVVIILILIFGVFFGFLQRTVFALCSKGKDTTRKQVVPVGGANKAVGNNAGSTYTFFHLIKSDDIATLIRLTKVTIKHTHNEELKLLLRKKVILLKQEYLIKREAEYNGKIDPTLNFIGFYSYDVRLHPTYKEQFAIEEQLDDENLD